jgi:hypothetical protein
MKINEVIDATLIVKLQQLCGPYIEVLKQTNGKPLYHGYKGTNFETYEGFKIISPRTDRAPTDTPTVIHNALNVYFTEKFGHPFRNGIFTTGDQYGASLYGTTYVLLPIGPLVFLWSDDIDDLFTVVEDMRNDLNTGEVITELTSHTTWQNNNLAEAITKEHEVMVMNKCIALTINEYKSIRSRL